MSEPRPKIGVFVTGGTILMTRDAEGTASPAETADISHLLTPALHDQYEFEHFELFNLDSTDVGHAQWGELADAIDAAYGHECDGYVVLHGTDTMPHTAAAVTYALGPPPIHKAVVFTGAQRTPDATDFDGRRNFADACAVAASDLGEVCIVFHGRILRGCRAEKIHATELDAFCAPESHGLGTVAESVELHEDALRFRPGWLPPFTPDPEFADGIASIALVPGQGPALYGYLLDPAEGCRAVLLQTFGAGNVPRGEPTDWFSFIQNATKRDLPVLLVSRFLGGQTACNDYAPGQAAVKAGAIPVAGMTRSALEVYISFLIAHPLDGDHNVRDHIRYALSLNLYGEKGGKPELPDELLEDD